VHWGRALYENIQRFIQFQLTINVSALVIAFMSILCGFHPPFTILQLLWINVIMDTLAAIALCSEPPRAGLMRLPPKRRDESIVTRQMTITIAGTALFFVAVMMAFSWKCVARPAGQGWFAGTGEWSEVFPDFTVRQGPSSYAFVLFQVWNEINCRSLVPEVSGLHGLERNPVFSACGSDNRICAGGHSLRLAVAVFQVERLGWSDWIILVAATASVIIYAEISRWVRMWLAPARS